MKDNETVATIGGTALMARLYWMFVGNALPLFMLLFIIRGKPSFPSWVDAAHWTSVALLLAVRYLDIRHLNGLTSDGQPASMTTWRRYCGLICGVWGGIWLVIRGGLFLFGAER